MSSPSGFQRPSRMKYFHPIVLTLVLAAAPVHAQNARGAAASRNPFSGNSQALAEGREIYNSSCTACHGYEGAGGERAPGLGTSGRRYLRTSDQELFDAVVKG